MVVYHTEVYNGNEPLKVVGIRKDQVELYGDYSGGTHGTYASQWFPLDGVLLSNKVFKVKRPINFYTQTYDEQ